MLNMQANGPIICRWCSSFIWFRKCQN